ncbi:hypothetical protein HPB48_025967 [Haemaphysalis longicornis]|uniref:Uncharacterized protein n=1 Tax=Haemaphysalis longicornis TaxID=44386 RepID=A0A9J6H8D9_HAELO|nr:hypothetical protein HPB48_025967 [Haemaphysalis longicornis]
MSTQSSNSRDDMLQFLKERVESHQGISIQKLTGHLSQLAPQLRITISLVKLNSVRSTDEDDVTSLTDVRGTVYRIFHVYGLISIEHPVKTSVYFDVQSFENAKHTNLPSSGLQVGNSVIFDARLGPKDCKAKFRASRVTRASMTTPSSSPCLSLPSANYGRVGDCDTIARLVDQDGTIEMVRSHFGFIKFGRNPGERAFFHADNLDKSLGNQIKNLKGVFTVEDEVRFDAEPSKKPSDKVKWEATTVYLCQSGDGKGTTDLDDEHANEVFLSDDEFDIEDFLLEKMDECKSHEADFNEAPAGYSDWDANSVQVVSNHSPVNGKRNARRLLPEWERRQKLSGEQGFFYPVTQSAGTVKFGVSEEVLVRLVQMVVEELIAKKAKLRVVLREVGVQVADEEPFQSPHSRPYGLVPVLVSSSTQTFSTGGIQ